MPKVLAQMRGILRVSFHGFTEASQQQFLIINAAENCCCSHGARCNCALKKDHLDPVPESDSDEASSSSTPSNELRRPRALTTQSDNCLTIFTNGHHKPVHKHNTMAHKCGLPYVVPKAHSLHVLSPSGLANRSVDNLPHTSTIEALHSESHLKDSMVSAKQEQRMVKSEHGSPLLIASSNLDQLNGQLPPLDFSNLNDDYSFISGLDGFSSVNDSDQPIFSAGLSSTSVDWSHYDGLDFNNEDFATSSYSQPPSFTGFDFSSVDQPALTTTSTSGEISEVEDFVPLTEPGKTRPILSTSNQYGSDFENSDYGGEVESYRLSNSSSYVGLPQAQVLASNNIGALDIEDFLKGTVNASSMGFVPTSGTSNRGLPVTEYADGSKAGHSSPFDDTNFQLVSNEDENDAFWGNDFPSGNGETSEDIVWAQ